MKFDLKMMILSALFTALTAVGAFVKIPINPPITMQFFFISLGAMLLGGYYGSLSQILYVLIGLLIAPIFAGGGGLGYIAKPSFGYILGFIPSAFVIGYISGKVKKKFIYLLLCCMLGTFVDYLFGVPYLAFTMNISFSAAVKIGCLMFLPGDIFKCLIASILAQKIIPQLNISVS